MLDQTLLQNNQKTRFWKEGMSIGRPPPPSPYVFFLYAAGRNFAGSLAGVHTTNLLTGVYPCASRSGDR
jgi:hypothetical protein